MLNKEGSRRDGEEGIGLWVGGGFRGRRGSEREEVRTKWER